MGTATTKPGYRALRKGRVSIPGQIYLVTTICHDRRAVFRDPITATSVAEAIADAHLWRDSKLLCWVLMPDHLHALVQLGATESLSKLVQRVKAVSARAAGRARSRTHTRTWMPGFHDRALRRDEDARSVARYVVANPLRARLAESPGEYPYWDAIWLRSDTGLLSLG